MHAETVVKDSLALQIFDRLEQLLLAAENETRPLELDPYRSQLFELFVMAEAAGFLEEESDPDLSGDGISHELARRWKLADAAREAVSQQAKLPAEHLSRMRLLWSCLRMWMEWTYAWQRWPEFHGEQAARRSATPPE